MPPSQTLGAECLLLPQGMFHKEVQHCYTVKMSYRKFNREKKHLDDLIC